jgi:hypothetical protein
VAGESNQLKGAEGVYRAMRWLNFSTRVANVFPNTTSMFGDLLHYRWPYGGQPFSFDIGGKLRGKDLEGKTFMGEVKTCDYEQALPFEYRKFVAACYVAFREAPARCDHFLWISWSPFQAKSWHLHRSRETIRKHLTHRDNLFRVFGTRTASEARRLIDEEAVYEISQRIWLLTLCEQQESLVLLTEHFKEVMNLMTVEGGIAW